MFRLRIGLWLCAGLTVVAVGCGGDDAPADGGGRDGGGSDARVRDGAPTDGPRTVDGSGIPCGSTVCVGFTYCDVDTCRPYEGCVATSTCGPGEICQHRFCIPEDADPDGDGYPVRTDCDETNPDINPGAPEVCNSIDDDCDRMADEGDPGELCVMDPSHGVCMAGVCGCPPGTYDMDHMPANGCECTEEPSAAEGTACGEAIDLGDLPESGSTTTVTGNVLPDDREVWYRFQGVDTPDTGCDAYHVRVQLLENPGDAFGFQVYRNACDALECAGGADALTDYSWATDFTDGAGNGQCPCLPPPGMSGLATCEDDTAVYYIRVFRRPGVDVACDSYALEVSNGVYSS